MAKKRGNNEGTIYKRNDGRWCAQVSLSGKRITKYAKTRRECHDWVKQISNKIEHGLTFDATQLTLERFMQSWLTGKDLSIRPNTARNYRRYSEQDILPVMGKMRSRIFSPRISARCTCGCRRKAKAHAPSSWSIRPYTALSSRQSRKGCSGTTRWMRSSAPRWRRRNFTSSPRSRRAPSWQRPKVILMRRFSIWP